MTTLNIAIPQARCIGCKRLEPCAIRHITVTAPGYSCDLNPPPNWLKVWLGGNQHGFSYDGYIFICAACVQTYAIPPLGQPVTVEVLE